MSQVKQKFRTWDISNTIANSMRRHHLSLLCRDHRSKKHLESVQSLKGPEAVVSEFLFQIKCLIQSFSFSALLPIWAESFFIVWGCPVQCWKFDSMPGLCPFDVSSNLQLWQPKNLRRYFQMSPGWQITIVDKYYLLREFSVVTGCFCLHPFVQNLITWPFLIVKEAGWHLCSKIGSSSVAEGTKYLGTAPSLHHVGKENSCLKYLCVGAFYQPEGKTKQWIWLKYLGLEIWKLLHWNNSNW